MKFHELNNYRLFTESKTPPPQETVEKDASKLNITEESQPKHSGSVAEEITECIKKMS